LQYAHPCTGYVSDGTEEIVITSPGLLLVLHPSIRVWGGLCDNRTQADSSPEVFQRHVDGVQCDGPPDETIERKPTRSVETSQAREVDRGHTAAVVAAEDALAPIGQVEWVEGDSHAFGWHADDHGLAATAYELGKQLEGFR
jgi:hypothetical protein